nr:SOS response-associated peptidase family protein [uncultured Albidiferax sp.]
MCYSAQVWADYRRYVRDYGAMLDIEEFYNLFWRRGADPKVKISKGMEMPFREATSDSLKGIQQLINKFQAEQTVQLEQELFAQRKRLADAERSLQTKVTKAAESSRRIATNKIDAAMRKLADLRRTEPLERDARIFPGNYAPVMVMENGKRVIKPMRYLCRPAGKPAFYDTKYPGTYNARRDSLRGFWKDLYGYSHGLVVVNTFYENVNRHRFEHRPLAHGEEVENVVLEFKHQPVQDMLIACLWSKWSAPGEPDLLSFAAITDEPPEEVAAAGHDRCIIQIRPENVDAWLNPDPKNLAALDAILEDKARLYYEHRLAA